VRIAEDEPVSTTSDSRQGYGAYSRERCLIKVYEGADNMAFGFWVERNTLLTMISILWKHWRHKCRLSNGTPYIYDAQVWTSMTSDGDELMTGHPQDDDENLSKFPNSVSCQGHLGSEKVYYEPHISDGNFGQPLVLKIKINSRWKSKRDSDAKLSRLSKSHHTSKSDRAHC